MRNIGIRYAVPGVLAAFLAVACGSSGSAERRTPAAAGGSGGSGAAVSAGGSNALGGANSSGGSSGTGAGGGPSANSGGTPAVVNGDGGLIITLPDDAGFNGCTATAVKGELRPVMLAVLLDRSGTMGVWHQDDNTAFRWTPVTTALKAFFADPASAGISASLQYFPLGVCDPAIYANPAVPMTPLPDPVSFAQSIDATVADASGTPMYTALLGTVTYLDQVSAANPGVNSAIVIATDGELVHDCGDDFTKVIAKVTEVAPRYPTYVIGIGNLSGLNPIAQAGGTGTAYLIDLSDPAQTQQQFLSAINAIRGAAVPCDIDIPPAPQGQTLDPGLVNVTFSSTSGSTLLYMSADCSTDMGWRYDNPAAPTRIELCPSACQTVKSGFGGSLDVQFGCATQVF